MLASFSCFPPLPWEPSPYDGDTHIQGRSSQLSPSRNILRHILGDSKSSQVHNIDEPLKVLLCVAERGGSLY